MPALLRDEDGKCPDGSSENPAVGCRARSHYPRLRKMIIRNNVLSFFSCRYMRRRSFGGGKKKKGSGLRGLIVELTASISNLKVGKMLAL